MGCLIDMPMNQRTRRARNNIIKAVAETYLSFNKEASCSQIADFINSRGLLFNSSSISSSVVSGVLKSAARGEGGNKVCTFSKVKRGNNVHFYSLNKDNGGLINYVKLD